MWIVFTTNEYYNAFMLDLFASQYWLVNVATYGTILIEIAYPFLIWQRRTRPYLLAAAIFLHAPVRLLMGSDLFLLRHDHGAHELRAPGVAARLGAWWKRRSAPWK